MRSLLKFSILLGLIIFAFNFSIYAKNTCSLKLEVFSTKTNSQINEADVKLTSLESKETFKPVIKENDLYFNELKNGEYNLSVIKADHEKHNDNLIIMCELVPDNWIFREFITLRKYAPVTDNVTRALPKGVFILGDTDIPVDESSSSPLKIKPAESLTIQTCKRLDENQISCRYINGLASDLTLPKFPSAARVLNAKGAVLVDSLVDKNGNVLSAKAVSGHPIFYKVCEDAAKASKFNKTTVNGKPVKVSGMILYNFVP